jgi:hypothetical protein
MSRKNEYIEDARRYARMIWDGINALESLQREATALDYGSTLVDASEYAAADVLAVVTTTTTALRGVMNAGHGTNIAKLL